MLIGVMARVEVDELHNLMSYVILLLNSATEQCVSNSNILLQLGLTAFQKASVTVIRRSNTNYFKYIGRIKK